MAVPGGLSAQVGVAEESTVGTIVTPDRFYEFGSETLKQNIERIEWAPLRAGRRVLPSSSWQPGRKGVEGDLEMAVVNKGMGLLFKHCLGAVATTTPAGGTTSREHKCTLGTLDGKGLTVQIGRTGLNGTTQAFTYAGCKVANFELTSSVGELLMLKLGLDGMSESTATALATAAYPTGLTPFVWTQGVLDIAGSEFEVTSASLQGDNGLRTDRYYMRSSNAASKKEQIEGAQYRDFTGTLETDWDGSLTAYNRFVNGETGSLTLTFTGAEIETGINYAVEVALGTVRFDGDTPNVGGPELIGQSLPYKVLDASESDGPVVVTVTNDDTAA